MKVLFSHTAKMSYIAPAWMMFSLILWNWKTAKIYMVSVGTDFFTCLFPAPPASVIWVFPSGRSQSKTCYYLDWPHPEIMQSFFFFFLKTVILAKYDIVFCVSFWTLYNSLCYWTSEVAGTLTGVSRIITLDQIRW